MDTALTGDCADVSQRPGVLRRSAFLGVLRRSAFSPHAFHLVPSHLTGPRLVLLFPASTFHLSTDPPEKAGGFLSLSRTSSYRGPDGQGRRTSSGRPATAKTTLTLAALGRAPQAISAASLSSFLRPPRQRIYMRVCPTIDLIPLLPPAPS